MLDVAPQLEQSSSFPLAFLITFRTYGTWLHGDKRGSVDRFRNRYGAPRIPANEPWRQYKVALLTQPRVTLNRGQRKVTEVSIRETCKIRRWDLWAVNVRSNHTHLVVTGDRAPRKILNALKGNATRKMREAGHWLKAGTPWARGGSMKWLWIERELVAAVTYVEYDQGEPLQ
jgi:REP element-mobilizing transposase RayT